MSVAEWLERETKFLSRGFESETSPNSMLIFFSYLELLFVVFSLVFAKCSFGLV